MINNNHHDFQQNFGLKFKLKLIFFFKRHFVRKGGFLLWRGDLSRYQYSTKETTISRKHFDVKNSYVYLFSALPSVPKSSPQGTCPSRQTTYKKYKIPDVRTNAQYPKKEKKQIKTSAPKSKLITFTQLSLHNKRLISLPVSFVIITNCILQTNESCVADFVRHYLIISNRKHTSNVSCYFSRAGSTVGSVA